MDITTLASFLTGKQGIILNHDDWEKVEGTPAEANMPFRYQFGENEFWQIDGSEFRLLLDRDAENRLEHKGNKRFYANDDFCETCPPYLQEWLLENEFIITTATECPATFPGMWDSLDLGVWVSGQSTKITKVVDDADNYTSMPYLAKDHKVTLLVTDAQSKIIDGDGNYLEELNGMDKILAIDVFNQAVLETSGIESEIFE